MNDIGIARQKLLLGHRDGLITRKDTALTLFSASSLRRVALLLGTLSLAACSTVRNATPSAENVFGVFKPYRIEIVQGNVVTQEVMAQIQPGLGRAQVREILGTPLLTDLFHENRWDYVFTIARQGIAPQQRRVTVFFKDNVVERFEADALPTEREFVASIDAAKGKSDKAAPNLSDAQIAALPVPPKVDTQPKVPKGANRDYPPLEAGRP
jgi:outer membrane protein assembly factor BamE